MTSPSGASAGEGPWILAGRTGEVLGRLGHRGPEGRPLQHEIPRHRRKTTGPRGLTLEDGDRPSAAPQLPHPLALLRSTRQGPSPDQPSPSPSGHTLPQGLQCRDRDWHLCPLCWGGWVGFPEEPPAYCLALTQRPLELILCCDGPGHWVDPGLHLYTPVQHSAGGPGSPGARSPPLVGHPGARQASGFS